MLRCRCRNSRYARICFSLWRLRILRLRRRGDWRRL